MTKSAESTYATPGPAGVALDYADVAVQASEAIHAVYAEPYRSDRAAKVAELHQRQGLALKLAEIHASLAIAQEVHALRLLINGLDR